MRLPVSAASDLGTHQAGTRGSGEGEHRRLLEGAFWQRVPAYRDIDESTFLDHRFQMKRALASVRDLAETLGAMLTPWLANELAEGLSRAPMSMRVSPYVVSLIDWSRPLQDPLRRQFMPLSSELEPDHPMTQLDPLAELAHSPAPGLVHRYADRALFLAQDRCPVYCRFCTRSYAVGIDTDAVKKRRVSAQPARWMRALAYLEANDEVEDVILSGGDGYSLRADQLTWLGTQLLEIGHIRRIRLATKGLAVLPMKILSDRAWTDALCRLTALGRRCHKEVSLITHINHPREITDLTRRAAARLFEAGVTMRNQAVLLRGVNDHPDTLRALIKRLGYIAVQPYYVHQHDLVRGVEDLRTSLATAARLEKEVRGATAGFHTPAFVVDAPLGGGKRDVHSAEHYDRSTGVSVFRSPNIDREARYLYFDPLHSLPERGRARWADPSEHRRIIDEALAGAA